MWRNRFNDTEDLVDFPCSESYLGAYAEQGLCRFEDYQTPDDPTLELKAELNLAKRGIMLTEPVQQKPSSKYGHKRNTEAIVSDLQRDVKGLKSMSHSHTKQQGNYKEYEV